MRRFAAEAPDALPLLALTCVFCRDPQLRASFVLIDALKPGEVLPRAQMEAHLASVFPERFSPIMLAGLATRVGVTWAAADHLQGRAARMRTLPTPIPAASTYAMFAGYLLGLRGDCLVSSVRVLGIVLSSIGLPEDLSVARLMLDLRDDDRLDELRDRIAAAGKDPDAEFDRFYTSRPFLDAYFATYPHLGDVKNVSAALRAQYAVDIDEVGIAEMLNVIRRALNRNGQLPCTVIVLDEIQQFSSNNADLAHDVQEVVEALSKEMDGKVLVIGTGQSALTDTPTLQRLMGRFTTKVHLKDNDVERVVRTVVLQKKEEAKPVIADLVSKRSGEIARQRKSTRIATRADDDQGYVPDYPLLPVRRRFWEQVLHSCDPSGTAAQMRTQLRVTHEACRLVAEQPLGAIIPADLIYDQLATELVTTGELQKRFQEAQDQEALPERRA